MQEQASNSTRKAVRADPRWDIVRVVESTAPCLLRRWHDVESPCAMFVKRKKLTAIVVNPMAKVRL